MLYCSNPTCSNPFSPDGNKFCLSCGSPTLSPLFRNRYRVIQLLGEGGFGRTYEAIDTDRMDDPCVIKQFFPQVQGTAALEKATELFKQEAKRLYELGEHPQIPRLIAYFEQDKRLYLVQELIEGQTLLAELQQQGAFSEDKIRQLLADLLPVLKIVHERGVIHRDIKPENIMRRKDGKLMLIDFGVSKQVTATILGQAGTTVGTHGYAPLEQMRGQVYPASDLYSLGVTCIRLLTQCLPKEDGSDQLYDAPEGRWIWQERLPQGTSISQELGQVLDTLLKDYVKERYQSADEVLQALKSVNSKPSRRTVQKPVSLTTPDPDNLISFLGIDYSKLKERLVFKDWRGADKETATLILKVASREKEGFLTVENIEKLPCEDLRIIDQLWVKYSKRHFGFSVQQQIWRDAEQNLETFGGIVGWRSQWLFTSSWKSYSAITFTLDAPKGHLPGRSVTVGREWEKNLWLLRTLFSRVKTCKL